MRNSKKKNKSRSEFLGTRNFLPSADKEIEVEKETKDAENEGAEIKESDKVTRVKDECRVKDRKINTVDVESERILSSEEVRQKNKERNNFLYGKDARKESRHKRLPWKEMYAFYVRGERVVKGGIKHTTSPTYKDVAERFNCSYASVCKYAREHNWTEKRKKYRDKLSTEFSFHGQLAADINGQVLNCASILVKKVTNKLIDPTFLATSDSIIEGVNGNFYVYDIDSPDLIPLPPGGGKESDVVKIEKLTKSLESINRICNNTVQVEIENASLLEELKGVETAKEMAKERKKRIEELHRRLMPSDRTSMRMSKREKAESVAKAREAKNRKTEKTE